MVYAVSNIFMQLREELLNKIVHHLITFNPPLFLGLHDAVDLLKCTLNISQLFIRILIKFHVLVDAIVQLFPRFDSDIITLLHLIILIFL